MFNQPAGTSADQLYITGLDEEPRVYPLSNNSVTIGRLPENDIVLAEDSVSSRHARLEKSADGWQVTDLNSTNGTYLERQELSPQVLQAWPPDTPLNIGPYTLTWQTAVIQPTMPMPPPVTAAPSSPVAPPANGGASNLGSIRLDPISVSLAPGSQATVEVHAVNEARHVEQYLVGIEGLPANWIQLHEERVQLMPNYQETIFRFVLRVPPQNAPAQTYPYRLVLRSIGDQREEGSAFGNLLVQPVPRFRASLNPRKIKNKGNCQVVIQNEGNAPANFVVSGHDENEAVAFAKAMQQITVPAGQEERVQFQIEAVNRPLTGKATAASFEFRVQPDRGEAQIAKGDLDIQPRLPTRLIVFLALLLGISTTIPAITLPRAINAASMAATRIADETATADLASTTEAEDASATATAAIMTQQAIITATSQAAATATLNASDEDGDGLNYLEEIEFGSEPTNPDTDGDGLPDGEEKRWGTNPQVRDTDDDTILDGAEVRQGTHPNNADTDGDNLRDNVDPEPGQLPTPTPTSTPLPEDHNFLPNPSFEDGHYNLPDENGTPIAELQVPQGWTMLAFDEPNSLEEGAGFFYRPEARVLEKIFLPEFEHALFVFDGDYTVKVFKGHAPTAFTLYTEVVLEQPGHYQLTLSFFPDVIVDYSGGKKIWATHPLSAEVSLIYGEDKRTNWGSVIPGQKNTIQFTFPVEEPGSVIVGASFRNRFAYPNNGWFLDDWSLQYIAPLDSSASHGIVAHMEINKG